MMLAEPRSVHGSIALNAEQAEVVRDILCRVLGSHGNAAGGVREGGVQAWIFGSRATGRARPYSDLDVLISQPPLLGWRERAELVDAFEASNLPFKVDVVEEQRLAPGMAARVLAERLPLI
jgi:predicted nucleotidyltransferase